MYFLEDLFLTWTPNRGKGKKRRASGVRSSGWGHWKPPSRADGSQTSEIWNRVKSENTIEVSTRNSKFSG